MSKKADTTLPVVVGVGVAALWYATRDRAPKAEAVVQPPEQQVPAIKAALARLPRTLCGGVTVTDADGPRGSAPLSAVRSGLVRMRVAQSYAFSRRFGAFGDDPLYPKLTLECLRWWVDQWRAAYGVWVAAIGPLRTDVDVGGAAAKAMLALDLWRSSTLLRVTADEVAQADRKEPLVRAAVAHLRELSVSMDNVGALGPRPPDPYPSGVGGFADAYSDNLSEWVIAPVFSGLSSVVSGVGGAVLEGVVGVVTSPVGAAAVIGLMLWFGGGKKK